MSLTHTFKCPDCGTHYKWRPSFVGRDLHCRCGCTFTPTPPPGAPTAAQPPPTPSPTGGATSPIQAAIEGREFELKPSTFTDKVLPAVLLCAGLPLGLVVTWLVTGGGGLFLAGAAGLIGFELLVGIPVMVGAIAWLASVFDEEFGTLGQVLLKVASVSVGTGLIADAAFAYGMTNIHLAALDYSWYTLYIGAFGGGLAVYIILQGLPAWVMFRAHLAVIATVILCNFLVRFVLFFAAFYALLPYWH